MRRQCEIEFHHQPPRPTARPTPTPPTPPSLELRGRAKGRNRPLAREAAEGGSPTLSRRGAGRGGRGRGLAGLPGAGGLGRSGRSSGEEVGEGAFSPGKGEAGALASGSAANCAVRQDGAGRFVSVYSTNFDIGMNQCKKKKRREETLHGKNHLAAHFRNEVVSLPRKRTLLEGPPCISGSTSYTEHMGSTAGMSAGWETSSGKPVKQKLRNIAPSLLLFNASTYMHLRCKKKLKTN